MFDDLVPVIEGYVAYCGRDKFTGNIREEFEEFTADQVYGSVLAYTVYNSGVPAALIYYSLLTEYGCNNVSIVVPSKTVVCFTSRPKGSCSVWLWNWE